CAEGASWVSLRTHRAGFRPRMHDAVELGFGYRHRLTHVATRIHSRAPAPRDELVLSEMVDDFSNALVAVPAPIEYRAADLTRRLVLPRHRERRQVPLRRAWDPARGVIAALMARSAMHSRRAAILRA